MKFQVQLFNKALKGKKRYIETHAYDLPGVADGYGVVIRTQHNGHYWESIAMGVRYENGTFYRNAAWPTSSMIEPMTRRVTWAELERAHYGAIRAFFPHAGDTRELDWFVKRVINIEEFRWRN